MNIIRKRNYFFLLSALVIIPGIIFLVLSGLLFSIDFTGGSRLEFQISNIKSQNLNIELRKILETQKLNVISIKNSQDRYIIRTDPTDQKTYEKINNLLNEKYGKVKALNFETVGASIGNETKTNALKAVIFASIAITLYIAFAFREVSKPVSSWKFGVAAIIALIHDVLVVVGIFAILGKFFGIEVDILFITALLTIMGFSVHDTIVVFDRIRENLKKNIGLPFDEIVNNSILETFNRSLNTSLTVVLVLSTLLLFGGESIRWFVVALLIGIISGTYSSIFNASPILVVWHEWDKRKLKIKREK